ncbi:hypothetical protein Tco_0855184 [Tanacetum coccineum]
MLHKSGRIDEDIAHRIKVAWLKWRAATRVICDRNPITKALANRMEVAELRMIRWTCGKTILDMIPNGVYRAELEVETIINKMREGRLRWFGHVRGRPQSAPVRRVEALVVDDMKKMGRPKLRWKDRVKLDMKDLLLSKDMTSDRNEWRARTSLGGLCLRVVCLSCVFSSLFVAFCMLDSNRLERCASIRLGGSIERFEGLVGFGLPLFCLIFFGLVVFLASLFVSLFWSLCAALVCLPVYCCSLLVGTLALFRVAAFASSCLLCAFFFPFVSCSLLFLSLPEVYPEAVSLPVKGRGMTCLHFTSPIPCLAGLGIVVVAVVVVVVVVGSLFQFQFKL